MSLIKEFNSLHQQIDRLFDDVVREQPQLRILAKSGETLHWSPAIEIQETETELLLKVQLPGIKPEELNIQVSENAVFLSGEHHEQSKIEGKGMVKTEFHYGQFKRVIPLHTAIQREHVQAEMLGGLLVLTMFKANPALPNLVKVPVMIINKPLLEVAEKAGLK